MTAETRQAMEPRSVTGIARRYFAAYEAKDRAAMDDLLTGDFTFISPFDDHLSRDSYFQKCWPQSERIKSIKIEKIFEQDNQAFVLYELYPFSGGPTFRNTEFMTIERGKIRQVEVFFGVIPPEMLGGNKP
ncbi:MAG TPA: nuclear transport factor 2 family protein [Pyrinomonadaceae bacterium]|jgi:hypothetical protein|nr:nuclear transport factor 2 family protein [Pyrinomonadaceae bacterium]